MAVATTQKFEQLILQMEGETPGTYTNICGLVDVTISRRANVDTAEIPDCADESKPLSIERQVRSIEVMVSATGVWAQESHGELMEWFYSSSTRNIRIVNAGAALGDTEFETGPALLTTLENARTKGQKVSASIEIMFDGTPTRTAQAA